MAFLGGGRNLAMTVLMALTEPKSLDWSKEFAFEILPIEGLKAHEATNPLLLRTVIEVIREEGRIRHPILVERDHHIILDGHHRYKALLALGCRRAPAYVVDYSSDSIQLSTWPGAIVDHITKEEVVQQVLNRKLLFPPKTTRHLLKVELPEHPVSLGELRDA